MTNPLPNVILRPDPRLPLLVVGLGAALLPLPWHPWPTLVVVVFGLFLLIQTASLRLEFEERALIVWQNGRELRRFPYEHWLAWRLFAPWLPGLFFFRETKSIHFLPILNQHARTARTKTNKIKCNHIVSQHRTVRTQSTTRGTHGPFAKLKHQILTFNKIMNQTKQ